MHRMPIDGELNSDVKFNVQQTAVSYDATSLSRIFVLKERLTGNSVHSRASRSLDRKQIRSRSPFALDCRYFLNSASVIDS